MTQAEVTAAAIRALSTKEKLRLAAQLLEDGRAETAKIIVDLAVHEMVLTAVQTVADGLAVVKR